MRVSQRWYCPVSADGRVPVAGADGVQENWPRAPHWPGLQRGLHRYRLSGRLHTHLGKARQAGKYLIIVAIGDFIKQANVQLQSLTHSFTKRFDMLF